MATKKAINKPQAKQQVNSKSEQDKQDKILELLEEQKREADFKRQYKEDNKATARKWAGWIVGSCFILLFIGQISDSSELMTFAIGVGIIAFIVAWIA